jgi:hypothetical protein
MSDDNLAPRLRRRAEDLLGRLAPMEREALLVKCWMSHDAPWFAAAALAGGMELANRLNFSRFWSPQPFARSPSLPVSDPIVGRVRNSASGALN